MKTGLNTWIEARANKKILLLRHGETTPVSNEKCLVGQTDLPLSEKGKTQAEIWKTCLADVSMGLVVSSDLSRCMKTARIVAGDACEIDTEPRLREIDLGRWDALPVREIKHRWPGAYRQRGLDMAGFRPPGGESFLDLQNRVVPAFESIVQKTADPILIVTHAGVIRVLLCHILGMPVENLFRIGLDYGSLTLVESSGNEYRVYSLNLLPGIF